MVVATKQPVAGRTVYIVLASTRSGACIYNQHGYDIDIESRAGDGSGRTTRDPVALALVGPYRFSKYYLDENGKDVYGAMPIEGHSGKPVLLADCGV